jgi:CHRD domain
MKTRISLAVALLGALVLALVGASAIAGDNGGRDFQARLSGYFENPSISTPAQGRFKAQIRGNEIHYKLKYSGIDGGNAFAAHIHFADRHVNGGIVAFLCGGGDKEPCPPNQGTVRGVIDPEDIIGPNDQGIEPTSFAEAVAAMRAGFTYANVHSQRFGNGEIRGEIRSHGD